MMTRPGWKQRVSDLRMGQVRSVCGGRVVCLPGSSSEAGRLRTSLMRVKAPQSARGALHPQLAPQLHCGPQVQGLHEHCLFEHLLVISRLLDGPRLDGKGLGSIWAWQPCQIHVIFCQSIPQSHGWYDCGRACTGRKCGMDTKAIGESRSKRPFFYLDGGAEGDRT
jgi:hypothetical protein